MAVTQVAQRSCPWVGVVLQLLKVLRGACPQQQDGYLEQQRRRMMMQRSTRDVGLVEAAGTYQEVGNITPACVQAIRTARRPPKGCRRARIASA